MEQRQDKARNVFLEQKWVGELTSVWGWGGWRGREGVDVEVYVGLVVGDCWAAYSTVVQSPQLPRLKSEDPRDSNGDISGFLHRGSYTVGPGVTLHLVWQMESRTWQQSFLLRGEGGYHS